MLVVVQYVERHLEPVLIKALASFRVVVLHGARQCGKTTLARRAAEQLRGSYVTLDDDASRLAVMDDPDAFLASLVAPAVIDEVQLGGDRVVRAVKRAVDDSPQRGRFLLTGSTNFLTVPTLSESLAGRARILWLHPFSEAELAGSPPLELAHWFDDCHVRVPPETQTRAQYMSRLCRGGYPEAVTLEPEERSGWFESYMETVIQRDITELADIRRASVLSDAVRWIAANTAGELNTQTACRQLGVDRSTFERYRAWLETVFLVHTVPAWSRKLSSRVVRRPKIHIADTGLAAELLGIEAEALAAPTSPMAGRMLETLRIERTDPPDRHFEPGPTAPSARLRRPRSRHRPRTRRRRNRRHRSESHRQSRRTPPQTVAMAARPRRRRSPRHLPHRHPAAQRHTRPPHRRPPMARAHQHPLAQLDEICDPSR